MTLSPEMARYIKTGRCPRCNTRILDANYIHRNNFYFDALFQGGSRAFFLHKAVPPGAKVRLTGKGQIQCLTCTKVWSIALGREIRPSVPVQKINLAGCSVVELRQTGQIERRLSKEMKKYSNDSKVATITKEVSVSNTVEREVTIESGKLRAYNAEAGIPLFGFAGIRGQIQNQLNEVYSVRTQSTITLTEKTTIQIPPDSTIEHIIRWMVVSEQGLAILGRPVPTASRLAEVPYYVPLKLTYTDEIRDVQGHQEVDTAQWQRER
jgi:hypothetical protein